MSEDESIARRFVHSLSSIVGFAYVVGLVQWREVRILMTAVFVVIVLLEVDRLILGNSLLDPLYRDYEEESPAGYAYAVSGMFFTVMIPLIPSVDPSVAVAAIFVLSYADPVIGLLSPNKLLPVKPVSLLVGMFAVSFVIIFGTDYLLPDVLEAVSPMEAPLGHPFPPIDITPVQAFGGAIGAMLADGIKLEVNGDSIIGFPEKDPDEIKGFIIDDNLTIPTLSGIMMVIFGLIPL